MKMKTIGLIMLSTAIGAGWMAKPVFAQVDQPAARPDKPATEQTFAGKVEALDPAERTLMVNGQQIYVVASTRLTRGDQPITLADIKVGDDVHGTSRPSFDGKTQAITVMVGVPDKK